MADAPELKLQCPLPVKNATVQLAHGGGGRLMQNLIRDIFVRSFSNPLLAQMHDGATWPVSEGTLAFTTDSYVVKPLFFPGGDIGSLAVHGTVNDLAMCGATPLWLSAGFILEEGLAIETLQRIVDSMAQAARDSGVSIVTGDTKVVDKGKGDGVFINTAGIGVVPSGVIVSPQRVVPGDAILVSGDLGSHGVAVLSVKANSRLPLRHCTPAMTPTGSLGTASSLFVFVSSTCSTLIPSSLDTKAIQRPSFDRSKSSTSHLRSGVSTVVLRPARSMYKSF